MRIIAVMLVVLLGFAAPAVADEPEPSPLGIVSFEVFPGIWFEGTAEELGQVVFYLDHVRRVNEFLEWHYRCVRHRAPCLT